MKILIILDIDEDEVIASHHGNHNLEKYEGSIESAVEAELGWVEQSGMSVSEVIAADDGLFKCSPEQFKEEILEKMEIE